MRVILLFALNIAIASSGNSFGSHNGLVSEDSQAVPTDEVLRVQRRGCQAKLNVRKDGNISVTLVRDERVEAEIIELKSGNYSLAIPKAKEQMSISWHTAFYHSAPLVIDPRPEFELQDVKVKSRYFEKYEQGFFDVEVSWKNPLPTRTIFDSPRPHCFLSGNSPAFCEYYSNTSVKISGVPSRMAIQTGLRIMVFDNSNCTSLYPTIHMKVTDCPPHTNICQPPYVQPDNVVNITAWISDDFLHIRWLSSPPFELVSVYALIWGYAGDLPEGINTEFNPNTVRGFLLKKADDDEPYQSASFNLSTEAPAKGDIIIQIVPVSQWNMTDAKLSELSTCLLNYSAHCQELLAAVFRPERVDLRVTSVHKDRESSSHMESGVESIEPVVVSDVESDSNDLKDDLEIAASKHTEAESNKWVTVAVPVLVSSLVFIGAIIVAVLRKNRKLYKNPNVKSLLQPNPLYHSLYKNIGEVDTWEIASESIKWGDRIGSGAFGSVYRCELQNPTIDGEQPQVVAVKTLADECNELSNQQFIEEMLVMKELNGHSNVIRLIGCVTLSQPACLITEYAANGDLLSYLQSIRLKELGEEEDGKKINLLQYGQLIQLAIDVAAGMEYISNKGYVHRDLAARNLLLDDCYTIKIADFGLTRHLPTEGVYVALNSKCLPVKWLSVEALTDLSFSPASDVWAFGVVLFELVTFGETPYPTIDPTDMLRYLVNGNRMGRPANCDEALYELMLSCWKPKTSDRPNFGELGARLTQLHPSYKSERTNSSSPNDNADSDIDEGCEDDPGVQCKSRLPSESSNYSDVNMIISSPELGHTPLTVSGFISQSECNSIKNSQSEFDETPQFFVEVYDEDSEKTNQIIFSTRL